jgi:hypothetical protein
VLQDANNAKARQLSVNAQGSVVKGSCIAVPDDFDLRTLIIRETHDSPYAGHYKITKTLCAGGNLYWWPFLKADITNFISTCPPCQRNKSRHHQPYGLYNLWRCLKDCSIPSTMTLLQSCLHVDMTLSVCSLTGSQRWRSSSPATKPLQLRALPSCTWITCRLLKD